MDKEQRAKLDDEWWRMATREQIVEVLWSLIHEIDELKEEYRKLKEEREQLSK